MRRLVLMTVAMVMAAAVAACGLPDDDNFNPIDESEDGFGLGETSTTSSTTTTTPTTTIDATTSSTIGPTTTTIPATEPVRIYFPTGQQLTPIFLQLAINPAPTQVIAAMLQGPPPGLEAGIRLILPQGPEFVPAVSKTAGVATVDFPEALFEMFQELSPLDQRLAFGQIVLTLCNRPGIGQVLFTLAGSPMLVFRGDGTSPQPDAPVIEQLVSEDDYTNLVAGSPPVTTSTTTTVPSIDSTATASTAEG
jgi:hypothetical protein